MFRLVVKQLILAFWVLLAPLCAEVGENSSSDTALLEYFFRDLFSTSTAGYVIFGSKPMYLEGGLINTCLVGTSTHREMLLTEKALDILRELPKKASPSPICIHFPSNSNREFFILNKDSFVRVVEQNLPLFQFIFGAKISGETLLESLLSEKETVKSFFGSHAAALGIVLGYGTCNSILYERGEKLQAQLSLPSQAFFPKGFGYASCQEELSDLLSLFSYAKATKTKIPFSYVKDSLESKMLLREYSLTEEKIDALMQEDSFLNKILLRLGKDPAALSCSLSENLSAPLIIQGAANAFHSLALYEDGTNHRHFFIEGMKSASPLTEEDFLFTTHQIQMACSPKARENLTFAKEFFSQLLATCLVPNGIYYREVLPGQGGTLSHLPKSIRLSYSLQDYKGQILMGAYDETFDPFQLILGLRLGIQGMKKGEVRDIFIHQDYVYGRYRQFGEGRPVSIHVELLDFEEGDECFSEAIPIDFLNIEKGLTSKQLVQRQKEYVSSAGLRVWRHYQKSQLFTLEDFMAKLQIFVKKPKLTEQEKKQLREIDLSLYNKTVVNAF